MKCILFVTLLASVWAAPNEISITQSIAEGRKLNQVMRETIKKLDANTALTILKKYKHEFLDAVHAYIAALPHQSEYTELRTFEDEMKNKVSSAITTPFLTPINSPIELHTVLVASMKNFLTDTYEIAVSSKEHSSRINERLDNFLKDAADITVRIVNDLKSELDTALSGASSSHS